jgi:antitoxin ParD1/3/4
MGAGGNILLVDLGDQMRVVEERVKDGSYASPDEVIRAALRVFDQGDAEEGAWLVALAEESLAEPGPDIPADEVFKELRARFGRPAVEPVG